MNLWSKAGAPHSYITANLAARPDADCIEAFRFFEQNDMLTRDRVQALGTLADEIRDTRQILAQIEPRFVEGLKMRGLPENVQAMALEIHALVVEAYVRSANAVFPLPGGRN